ncbi:flowering time control protein FCA [Cucumis melo var. makuwa]|uniref:Flowering time control protein FCA n=1 Tax=Cucumis melo var. makuwa TaxID=1194695 RepID=A0A5D3DA86_CUCMM|nr:flowering time control protein FCA [Cucumis melo var. makuwa]TYK20487.1 flowering time control protein FCA [Cucumis melo var. makuwa]
MKERKSEEGKKKGEEKSERKQHRRGNDKYLVGEVKKLPEAEAAAGRKVEGLCVYGWNCRGIKPGTPIGFERFDDIS